MAENLFLRKQLVLYQERKARPRRTKRTLRLVMVALSRFFHWRDALVIVKPETFIKWHRTAFRTWWRWKSRKRGRPALPKNLKELIHRIARDNPIWGEERIADELQLKLGIRVSPRTVEIDRVAVPIRECLDFLIPINERHLRRILREFVMHYNRGRPHSALGPGIPDSTQASLPASGHRHRLPVGYRVRSEPVVGGLHHEYSLGKEAA